MRFKKFLWLMLFLIPIFPLKAEIALDTSLIYWRSDSCNVSDYRIHPNGNIIARNGALLLEIDGNTGHILRNFVKKDNFVDYPSFSISKAGKYIALGFDSLLLYDYKTGEVTKRLTGYCPAFFPDSKRMLYGLGGINVYDIQSGTSTNLDLKNMSIDYIEISEDGKYIAIGYWKRQTNPDKDLYSCELWDANTLKSIGFLFKDEEYPSTFFSIKFSLNSKYVGMLQNFCYLRFFRTEDLAFINSYNTNNFPDGADSFCFINDTIVAMTTIDNSNTRYIYLKTLLQDKNIYINNEFGFCVDFNKINNSLLSVIRKGMIALKYPQILTEVKENIPTNPLNLTYKNGLLLITNIFQESEKISVSIFDINGNSLLNLQKQNEANDEQIIVPFIHPNGVYLVKLKSGSKEYSGKFIINQ